MSIPTAPPPPSSPPSGAPPPSPGQPGKPKTHPWRVVGIVIAVLFVVLFVAVVLINVFGEAERGEEGDITEPGSLGVEELQVGDCFDEPGAMSADEVTQVFAVEAMNCSEPHDFELFHTYELTTAELPSDAEVQSDAGERCTEAFESYVGVPFEESELDFGVMWPTEDSWAAGDHTVMCALQTMDGSKLEGTAAGSGR
jgi:hypothetical protein